MARVLDELPGNGAGAPSKYPWVEWMDGRVWAVTRGEDYACKHESFRMRLHHVAAQASLHVTTRRLAEGDEQVGWAFQFSRNGDEAPMT